MSRRLPECCERNDCVERASDRVDRRERAISFIGWDPAGDLQFNHNSVDSTARAFTGGAPLKFVGSAQHKPTFRLLVGKDIKDWNSPRGKYVGDRLAGRAHAFAAGRVARR